MGVLIFWLIVFAILMSIRHRNINRAIHEAWQEQEVLAIYGTPSDRCRKKFEFINSRFIWKNILGHLAIVTKTWDPTPIGIRSTCMFLSQRDFGAGDIIMAVNVDVYASKMSRRSLRYRDVVYEFWTNRPTDLDYKDILKIEMSDELLKEFDEQVSAYMSPLLEMPPEIRAKLDGPERKEFLRQLNIF